MMRVLVHYVADAKFVTCARRRRAASITGLFTLIAGFAWLLAVAPAFVAFGLAVTSAVAWCIWLEKHPEAQTERLNSTQTQHLSLLPHQRPAKASGIRPATKQRVANCS